MEICEYCQQEIHAMDHAQECTFCGVLICQDCTGTSMTSIGGERICWLCEEMESSGDTYG